MIVDYAVAGGLLVLAGLVALTTLAAVARFIEPDTWRVATKWARWRRTAAVIDRVALSWLEPLRALVFWLVASALVLGFVAVPAIFFLLSELF